MYKHKLDANQSKKYILMHVKSSSQFVFIKIWY